MECSVCYGDEGPFQKLCCGHTFCKGCIKTWYQKGANGEACPMCRAPIYFKGFHKVKSDWAEEAYEGKCAEVFGQALDECFADAQEFAEDLPPRLKRHIFDALIEDFIDLDKTFRYLRYEQVDPEDMDDVFYWGEYYSDRHMEKCWWIDEPSKEFATRHTIVQKAGARGFKRARAREDPWFTVSFYIEV